VNQFNPRPGKYVEPIPVDAKKRDQNTAVVGPVRIDFDEQVRQVLDQTPTPTGGGVSGSAGFVVGIPPGIPYVYVPANLVSFPIDFSAVPPLKAEMSRTTSIGGDHIVDYEEGKLNVDSQNVIGTGGQAVLGVYGTTLRAYDTSTGLATSVSLPTTYSDLSYASCVNNKIVVHRTGASSVSASISLHVYDGSTVSTVSFPSPSGTLQYCGSGSSGDGLEVVIAWRNPSNTLYVARYDTAGVLQSQKSITFTALGLTSAIMGGGAARVENGYVLFSGTTHIVATEDDTASGTWIPFVVDGPGEPNMCMGPNGIGWAVTATTTDPTADIDVHILDFSTGSVNTFVQALTGWVSPFDPVAANISSTHGICYLSDTKMGVCSGYYNSVAGTIQPIYITVTYTAGTPGTLTLSQLYFSAYETATTYPASIDYINQYCYAPVKVGSDVVFTIQTDGTGSGGWGTDLDWMWRVTA
jgi:hypothetical protein